VSACMLPARVHVNVSRAVSCRRKETLRRLYSTDGCSVVHACHSNTPWPVCLPPTRPQTSHSTTVAGTSTGSARPRSG
jgi:hypothetical protein